MSPSVRWFAVALVALAACFALAVLMYPDLLLPLGSSTYTPTFGLAAFGAIWTVYGTFTLFALTMAVAHLLAEDRRGERWRRRWLAVSDRAWVLSTAVLATLAAVLVRTFVLSEAALTDDEASYRFAAQLIASGRLWIESPPMKLFFDHGFLLNDGRLQSMYFLGWPVLQAPGVWLGIPGSMNALYFGATVPAFFLLARRFYGAASGRLAALLVATSPFLVALAATELSHTTSLMALAWAVWFFVAGREPDATWRPHAGFAALYSLAFFVRPITAAGLGVPLLALWLWDRIREPRGRGAAVLALAVPAMAFGGLFLAAQRAQHGSPFTTGYHHSRSYMLANDFRFSTRVREGEDATPGLRFSQLGGAVGRTASGLYSLGQDLFGWPLGLAAVVPALLPGVAGLAWMLAGGGVLGVLFDRVVGVDSFGPVHYSELALPVVLLIVAGIRAIAAHLAVRERSDGDWRCWLVAAGVVSLLLAAWIGYVPLRWRAVSRMAASIQAPLDAVADRGITRAVIFAPLPWVQPGCMPNPSHHFRFQRPVPGPDLDDDVLWVNHVDVATDRSFLGLYPGRRGYGLVWGRGCRIELIPLETATEETLPPGRQSPLG